MAHRTNAELEPHLDHLRGSPTDVGTLEMVVCRPAPGRRRILDSAVIDLTVGLVGDSWSTRDENPDPDEQLTVMNARMAALLDDDPLRQALAGDQLYVDLDLSVDNLPAGARLGVGTAVIEVTGKPHNGCGIFMRYFGEDATRFVNSRVGRRLRLRGLNARVVTPGIVGPGDQVRVIHKDAMLEVQLSPG